MARAARPHSRRGAGAPRSTAEDACLVRVAPMQPTAGRQGPSRSAPWHGRPDPLSIIRSAIRSRDERIAADQGSAGGLADPQPRGRCHDGRSSPPPISSADYDDQAGPDLAPPAHLRAVSANFVRAETGKTLAVVGESGCGKSTLARLDDSHREAERRRADAGRASMRSILPPSAREGACAAPCRSCFKTPTGRSIPASASATMLEEPLLINTSLSKQERPGAGART